MLRGEKEKKCLNDVRKILRTKPCFLCVDEDILKDIMTAKANEQENNFPDFVLENGFIEHFAVTTAKETAKGSSYRQKESDYQRTTEKECKELQEDWKKSEFHPNTITTVPHEFVFTEK